MKISRVGIFIAFTLISACNITGVAPTSYKFKWRPPPQGVIRDKEAAISISRSIWFSMNPRFKKSSDEFWQKDMEAQLIKGIWRVRQKSVGPNSIGGGIEIDLDAKDGKVVRIIFTQ